MILSVLAVFLCACSSPHLDIFPELSDPALVNRKIPVTQLREDVDAFVNGIKFRHPNYGQYADSAAIDAKINELKQKITEPMTRVEFFRVVGQLSHLFNDGHSFLIWPYQEFSALQESGNKPFPFAIRISAEKVYLKHSYQSGEQVLPRGTKIESVNDIPISKIFETAQMYVGGETKTLRKFVVASRFAQTLWSVYGFASEFDLVVKTNGKEKKLRILNTQNWQLIGERDSNQQSDFYFKVIKTKARSHKVGYLYVGSFDIDMDWFTDFIDTTFEEIKQQQINALIIDIRENSGGNTDAPAYLSQYIANQPFRMVSALTEKLNTENRGWFNYKGEVGEVIEEEWTDWLSPKSEAIKFSGDTYLLISPLSYSSAIVFSTTLKDNQFATLVGQETGGFANQTAQGNLFNLPNSALRAYVPTRLLVRPNADQTVTGVKPDVMITPTSQNIADGIDTELQATLAIIESKLN